MCVMYFTSKHITNNINRANSIQKHPSIMSVYYVSVLVHTNALYQKQYIKYGLNRSFSILYIKHKRWFGYTHKIQCIILSIYRQQWCIFEYSIDLFMIFLPLPNTINRKSFLHFLQIFLFSKCIAILWGIIGEQKYLYNKHKNSLQKCLPIECIQRKKKKGKTKIHSVLS